MEEAYALCDEIVIMDKGLILSQGTPKGLVKEHYDAFQLHLPQSAVSNLVDFIEHEIHDDNIIIHTQNINQTIAQLVAHKASLDELVIRRPTLEDLFLDLTGHSLRD